MDSEIDILPMPQARNRQTPTGGVNRPIARLTTMIIPKCTGLTPRAVTIGIRIGQKTVTAGLRSIQVPTNSRRRFMSRSIRNLLVVRPRTAEEIIAGTFW